MNLLNYIEKENIITFVSSLYYLYFPSNLWDQRTK